MKYWKTAPGSKILVSTMQDSHIQNCIRMLERYIENTDDFELQGYCVFDDFDSYDYEEADMRPYKNRARYKIREFKKELLRRKNNEILF